MTQSLPSANSADVRSPEKTGRRLAKYGGFAALVLVGVAAGFGLTYLVQPSGIGSATGITALLTVAAALLGVVLTNQHNANRQSREIQANEASQRAQLDSDRELAEKSMIADRQLKKVERDMSFRKEIFSNAVGAAGAISQVLAKYIDSRSKLDDLSTELQAQMIQVGKVNLVANNATLSHVIDYLAQLAEELFPLLQIHSTLGILRIKIETEQEHRDWIRKQQTEDAIKAVESQVHAAMAKFWEEHLTTCGAKIAQLREESGKQHLAGWEFYMAASERISLRVFPMIVSMRSELGDTEFDGVAYEKETLAKARDVRAMFAAQMANLFGGSVKDVTATAANPANETFQSVPATLQTTPHPLVPL